MPGAPVLLVVGWPVTTRLSLDLPPLRRQPSEAGARGDGLAVVQRRRDRECFKGGRRPGAERAGDGRREQKAADRREGEPETDHQRIRRLGQPRAGPGPERLETEGGVYVPDPGQIARLDPRCCRRPGRAKRVWDQRLRGGACEGNGQVGHTLGFRIENPAARTLRGLTVSSRPKHTGPGAFEPWKASSGVPLARSPRGCPRGTAVAARDRSEPIPPAASSPAGVMSSGCIPIDCFDAVVSPLVGVAFDFHHGPGHPVCAGA